MRRKIDLLVALVLIAGVIVMVAIGWQNSRSARGDDATAAPSYDVGPYGTPLNQIPQNRDPWGFTNTPPLVYLKDLPPLPPPFGPGGSITSCAHTSLQIASTAPSDGVTEEVTGTTAAQSTNPVDNLSPDLQAKIAQMKARGLPWDNTGKGGN